MHGQSRDRHKHIQIKMNSWPDTRKTTTEKLKIFEAEIEARNNKRRCDRPWPARTASRHSQPDNITSALAQYTLPMRGLRHGPSPLSWRPPRLAVMG
jgi:hypothetical protein